MVFWSILFRFGHFFRVVSLPVSPLPRSCATFYIAFAMSLFFADPFPSTFSLCFNPLVIATNCFWLAVSMSIFVLSLPSLLLFILFLQVFLYPFRPVSFASLSTLLLLDSLLRNSDPWVICELFLFSFLQS